MSPYPLTAPMLKLSNLVSRCANRNRNSTNADPGRMSVMLPMAASHNCNIIALSLRATGLPVSADARIEILTEDIMPALEQYGLAPDNVYLDPLAMTVNGCQEHAPEVVKAVRVFSQISDPPFHTTCGLSNVSNGIPPPKARYTSPSTMPTPRMRSSTPEQDAILKTVRVLENKILYAHGYLKQ